MAQPSSNTKRKLSPLAIGGLILLPFGFLLVIFIPPGFDALNSLVSRWSSSIRYLLLALASLAPIGSTILGFLSTRQIKHSRGDLYGMPLAVGITLFYPIIVLTLLLFILGFSTLGTISQSSLVPLVWFFLVMIIDYWLVRIAWRRFNR
jgi:hypothetical protein